MYILVEVEISKGGLSASNVSVNLTARGFIQVFKLIATSKFKQITLHFTTMYYTLNTYNQELKRLFVSKLSKDGPNATIVSISFTVRGFIQVTRCKGLR